MINKHTKQVQAVPCTLSSQVNLVSREQFNKVQRIQPALNQLVQDISVNRDFLRLSLEHVIEEDDFTKKLFEIYEEQQLDEASYGNKVQMGIHRSDYMLHFDQSNETNNGVLQQVELNTISSAFGALSTKATLMHQMLASKPGVKVEVSPSFYNNVKCLHSGHQVFKNLIAKDALLLDTHQENHREPVILFVVQPDEGNFADQRHYEYELYREYGVRCVRKTLTELATEAKVDAHGFLFIEDNVPVSVVYFRSGYGPGDYPTEQEWNARRLLESSKAINCPSIGYQLAGTKKVQQILADPKNLSQFIKDDSLVQALMETFTGIYALSNPDHAEHIADAINNPQDYVLKPQREGGGNLIFGEKMVEMLKDEKQSKSQQYILMKRICPRGTPTVFFKDGVTDESLGVSELGIFGTFVGSANKIHLNECSGYLLRTKKEGVEDGGVASGVAVLDSLAFTD